MCIACVYVSKREKFIRFFNNTNIIDFFKDLSFSLCSISFGGGGVEYFLVRTFFWIKRYTDKQFKCIA